MTRDSNFPPAAPPAVSIVIPVYNTAPYLRRCLDSVCGQTLRDIEIICVNDGSTDGSPDIVREYAARDARVRLIDFPKNRGVSVARNAGMAAARGDWLGFVDSDDYVDDSFYARLHEKALAGGADIVKGNMRLTDLALESTTITTLNQDVRKHKIHFTVNFTTALYQKEFIARNAITFPPGCLYGEDRCFAARCAVHAGAVATVDNVFYHYFRSHENAADQNFISKAKALSYASAIKALLRSLPAAAMDGYSRARIFATFLLELIRVFRIAENSCRRSLLRALFDLKALVGPEQASAFQAAFAAGEPRACRFLAENNLSGLHEYLVNEQTQNLIRAHEEKQRQSNALAAHAPVPVFLSADDNYAPIAAAAMASICHNTARTVQFYVLDGGITPRNRKKMESLKNRFANFAVEWISVDTERIFRDFPLHAHITLSMYNRFLIPGLKPDLAKAVYLDADVIALGDIAPLYDEPLNGFGLAAVPEQPCAQTEQYKQAMELSPAHRYFNSGVLLIDCRYWRARDITGRLFAVAEAYKKKLVWPDQDILNKVFDAGYQVLPAAYNVMTAVSLGKKTPERVVIRHFNTIWKPWNHNGVHGAATVWNFNNFWQYAAMTPFLLDLLQKSGIGLKAPWCYNPELAARNVIEVTRKRIAGKRGRARRSSGKAPVSVIVPAYNAAAWLPPCLASLCGQTYANLEIICVDDGSTDKSAQVLAQYARNDPRVRALRHEKNEGLGAARNTGLAAARGEFVYFMDSDDRLAPDYLDAMVGAAERSGLDIVLNTSIAAGATGAQFLPHLVPDVNHACLPAKENILKVVCNVWAHLYRRSFLMRNALTFMNHRTHEDLFFQYAAYAMTDKIYVIRDSAYYYTVREGSLTDSVYKNCYRRITGLIGVMEDVYNFYQSHDVLDKYDIKMFSRECFPPFTEPKKAELCRRLRGYFDKLAPHVAERCYLYDNDELAFFYGVLSGFAYATAPIYSKRFFALLRKKLQGGTAGAGAL